MVTLFPGCRVVLLCFILSATPLLGQNDPTTEPPQPDRFQAAQVDAVGTVWAIAIDHGYQKLFRLNGATWTPETAPFPEAGNAIAEKLFSLSDGSVACFWGWNHHEFAVSRHKGKESRLIAKGEGSLFKSPLQYPPFEDSKKRLWFTGNSPDILCVEPDGQIKNVYTIKPEDLINPSQPFRTHVLVTEDGRGRIWIWNRPGPWLWSAPRIKGALLIDGEKITHCSPIKDESEPYIYGIFPKDTDHLWIVLEGGGMSEVQIDTLESKPLPQPEPGKSHYPQMIFTNGNDLYYMSPFPDKNHTLWRYSKGTWTTILSGVDQQGANAEERPLIRTAQGFILPAFGASPWYIPDNGTPVSLDWRYGFPFAETKSIFLHPDHSLFALSRQGKLFHGVIPIPPGTPHDSRAKEDRILSNFVTDSKCNAWTIRAQQNKDLSQWNGKQWIPHPLPNELFTNLVLAVDSKQRIWLFSNDLRENSNTAIFNSETGNWLVFASVEKALESLKSDLPEFEINQPDGLFIELSKDHQKITFYKSQNQMACFDGSKWDYFKISPYNGHHPQDRKAPEGWPFRQYYPDSGAFDNKEIYWGTHEKSLYKYAQGICIDLFPKGDPNPFMDHSQIKSVWLDRSGNAFLLTNSGYERTNKGGEKIEYYTLAMIAPKNQPPHTLITLKKTGDDSINLRLKTLSDPAAQFQWQLDDGPWQSSTTGKIDLQWLKNGSHKIHAYAIDSDLQKDQDPATADFEIKINEEKQLRKLKEAVTQLSDPDFEKRKTAIDRLVHQPEIALPALQIARANANDDLRWWIDATLQQINREAKHTSSP